MYYILQLMQVSFLNFLVIILFALVLLLLLLSHLRFIIAQKVILIGAKSNPSDSLEVLLVP